MKKEVLTVRADKKTKSALKKISKDSNRSMSDYLRLLIEYAEKQNIKL